MNEIKNFALGAIGTLGLIQITDDQAIQNAVEDPQTTLIKTVITLLAGILTTVLTRWFKKKQQRRETGTTKEKLKNTKKD